MTNPRIWNDGSTQQRKSQSKILAQYADMAACVVKAGCIPIARGVFLPVNAQAILSV